MPELPEVEILVRHLAPVLKNKTIRRIQVRRAKVIAPTPERHLVQALQGATFKALVRRGKYLLFTLRPARRREPLLLVGHLGMTGRMFLLPQKAVLPKHAAVVLNLGRYNLIYEDTRYFGRFTLDTSSLSRLGPEPFGPEFTVEYLAAALKRSAQPIKIKLLDQALVAGVGNIYASEALFRAGISPRLAAKRLKLVQVKRLLHAIQAVLGEAIEDGSTIPLDFAGTGRRDGLFYYGSAGGGSDFYQERLRVYDHHGRPCSECGTPIRRLFQAARSTFYCPNCQQGA
ncbi:MAG: Formamidopyrimidine-DNA glycosylase [Pedosphaera sp.]|nr:Formamidopyrimidine-DNA glycosylase [Pedosphaera sp.]